MYGRHLCRVRPQHNPPQARLLQLPRIRLGLVQSLVAAVQASVQTALAPLVEAAVQQHSRASGNPFTSGLGDAANRFEMSGEPSFLSAPSPSSSRTLEMAARRSQLESKH